MSSTDELWPEQGSAAAITEDPPAQEGALKRGLGAFAFIGDTIRRRRSSRMALWGVVALLAIGGVWLIAKPIVTDIWASRLQTGLEQDFAELQQQTPPDSVTYVSKPAEGNALTRLKIPKIGVDMIVVEGVSGNALRAGAGHFPESALPGDLTGNVAIAGHRTGFGEPFRHIDKLTAGDEIILVTPYGRFVYVVSKELQGGRNPEVFPPTALWVKYPTAEPVVTLITCDPPGTSKNRLVVRAALVRT